MFADNTNVFAVHKNADKVTSIVNTELIKVVNWLKINKLSLNPLDVVSQYTGTAHSTDGTC